MPYCMTLVNNDTYHFVIFFSKKYNIKYSPKSEIKNGTAKILKHFKGKDETTFDMNYLLCYQFSRSTHKVLLGSHVKSLAMH